MRASYWGTKLWTTQGLPFVPAPFTPQQTKRSSGNTMATSGTSASWQVRQLWSAWVTQCLAQELLPTVHNGVSLAAGATSWGPPKDLQTLGLSCRQGLAIFLGGI